MITEKEVTNMSFHEYLKGESQKMRGIWNYLQVTYENLNGHVFDFDEESFESERDFFEYVAGVCEARLMSMDIEEFDNEIK